MEYEYLSLQGDDRHLRPSLNCKLPVFAEHLIVECNEVIFISKFIGIYNWTINLNLNNQLYAYKFNIESITGIKLQSINMKQLQVEYLLLFM
jgi:hypothetical protein